MRREPMPSAPTNWPESSANKLQRKKGVFRMIGTEQTDRLLRFFEEMLAFYRDFLEFERRKYGIIVSGDLAKLDESLRQEQAFTLKARGLESDRVKLLEKTGCSGFPFRDLPAEVDPSRREAMQKLYENISVTVRGVQQVNKRCAGMTKVKMARASKTLSEMENHPELKKIYGEKFKGNTGTGSTFSRKI